MEILGKLNRCLVSACDKPSIYNRLCTKHNYYKYKYKLDVTEDFKIELCKNLGCKKPKWFDRDYCIKCHVKINKLPKNKSISCRYHEAKNAAKARNREFTLTKSQYEQIWNLPCHYCGNKYPNSGSGLDRKDPNRGYSLDNVVPACKFCNRFRNSFATVEEMEKIIQILIESRKTTDIWKDKIKIHK